MWKRFTKLFVLSAAVLLVTAACAKTPGINASSVDVEEAPATEATETVDNARVNDPSSGADRVVEVQLSEFAIDAASLEFAPGETVEFIVTNIGVVEHELRLSNQDRVDEHVGGGHGDHDEGAMSDEEMGTMDEEEADSDAQEADHDEEEADSDAQEADHDAEEAEDAVLILAAGESGTLVFTFPENDHDYTAAVCLIPGHYEAGMASDLSYAA